MRRSSQGTKKQPSYARSIGSSIADEEMYVDDTLPPTAPSEPVDPPPCKPPSRSRKQKPQTMIDTNLSEDNLDRPYDLTPLGHENTMERPSNPGYTIDPWELPNMEQQQNASPVPPG